jgi:hypothetical protein
MKTSNTALVLAAWSQVEEGDTVWYGSKLFTIDGGPYELGSNAPSFMDGSYRKFTATKVNSDSYYSNDEIVVRLHDLVPVVVP